MADDLGKRISQIRGFTDLSARETDRLAGLREGHTRQIEVGSKPSVEARTAAAIAELFGVSLDWLLAGRGRAPSAKRVRRNIEIARAAKKAA